MITVAVIPVYNERERIADVIRRTRQIVPVIVVDDGSGDDSADRAERAGAEVIRFERNQGKSAALERGFAHAVASGADAAVTLDGDGQHRPEEIPLFMGAALDGADVVVGTRMTDVRDMPTVRLWTNWTTSRIVSWLARARLTDSQSGYRLFRSEVLRTVKVTADRFAGESEVLILASRRGFRIAEVPVSTIYFGTEDSKIDPFWDTINFFKLVSRYL